MKKHWFLTSWLTGGLIFLDSYVMLSTNSKILLSSPVRDLA